MGAADAVAARADLDRHATSRRRVVLTVVLPLLGLMAVSLLLRLEGQNDWLWMDEGISVGIASHRIVDIPTVLAKDASPPLYYVLLHTWMRLVGTSEVQTHALSLLFALLFVPTALWAGWSLFGPKVGWFAAALAATAPYLTDYSHETRMYTLVALLGMVVVTSFAHAFVLRRRRFLPLFVASLTLLLYTHNWGIYVAVAGIVALVPCLLRGEDRSRLVRDGAVAFGVVGLLYLPWVPTLLEQVRHTGAPWSPRPVLRELISGVGLMLGDPTERVLVALVVGGATALWALVRRYRTPEGTTVLSALVITAVTLGTAWLIAQAKPAWTPRYLAVVLGSVLLVAATILARGGAQGLLAFVVILVIWTQPLGRLTGLRQAVRPDQKSPVKPFAAIVSPELRPGDLVVSIQMEEVPVLHYYLPRYVRFADVTGLVSDPTVVDWRDALDRVRRSSPESGLRPLVAGLPHGGRLLVVCTGDTTSPRTLPWFQLMDERCEQWQHALDEDGALRSVPVAGLERLGSTMSRSVRLFEKG